MICVIKYSICVFLLAPLGRGTSHQLLETAANAFCIIFSEFECDVLDRIVAVEQHFGEAADTLLGDILVDRLPDDLLEPYLQQPAGKGYLLENIVAFCNDNPTMDADSVSQLISILETTISAFSALDDNVNTTNESSKLIRDSIKSIIELVAEINTTLIKTEEE